MELLFIYSSSRHLVAEKRSTATTATSKKIQLLRICDYSYKVRLHFWERERVRLHNYRESDYTPARSPSRSTRLHARLHRLQLARSTESATHSTRSPLYSPTRQFVIPSISSHRPLHPPRFIDFPFFLTKLHTSHTILHHPRIALSFLYSNRHTFWIFVILVILTSIRLK